MPPGNVEDNCFADLTFTPCFSHSCDICYEKKGRKREELDHSEKNTFLFLLNWTILTLGVCARDDIASFHNEIFP